MFVTQEARAAFYEPALSLPASPVPSCFPGVWSCRDHPGLPGSGMHPSVRATSPWPGAPPNPSLSFLLLPAPHLLFKMRLFFLIFLHPSPKDSYTSGCGRKQRSQVSDDSVGRPPRRGNSQLGTGSLSPLPLEKSFAEGVIFPEDHSFRMTKRCNVSPVQIPSRCQNPRLGYNTHGHSK